MTSTPVTAIPVSLRDDLIGRWARYVTASEDFTGIIFDLSPEHVTLLLPAGGRRPFYSRPLTDLHILDQPRAWTPDGKPLPGQRASGSVHLDGHALAIECHLTGEFQEMVPEDAEQEGIALCEHTARRFISDWQSPPVPAVA